MIPRARHVIELSESDNNSGSEVHNSHESSIVCSGTASINRQTISHARDHQALHNCQHHVLREEASQVAETNQEADTSPNHVTDVGVPGKVAVKQHTQVLHTEPLCEELLQENFRRAGLS